MFRSVAAAALAAALLAAPALAGQDSMSAPTGPVTLAAWTKRVGGALDQNMQYPHPLGRETVPSGIVQVKFNCSESGRPGQVAIYKSSGDPWLDRAALTAVRRVATLHPLPDGMSHQQRYVATLLFASSYDEYEAQVHKLRADALKANAWFKGSSGIALLPVPSGAAN